MKGSVEGGIQLVCTAKGWFPEPRVRWEDSQGEWLLSLSEHYFQDANGLFYVEATLLVLDASPESVSCIIHNPVVSEERVATITLPGQCSSLRVHNLSYCIEEKHLTSVICVQISKISLSGLVVHLLYFIYIRFLPSVHSLLIKLVLLI